MCCPKIQFPSAKIVINVAGASNNVLAIVCEAIHIHSVIVPYNTLEVTIVIPIYSMGI